MENKDKIYEQFKDAAQKAESKDFPAMDKVWNRVEDKLDKKEDKKEIALWKKLAVAASLLLFFSLGYQFFKMSSVVVTPSSNPEKDIVIKDSVKDKIQKPQNENAVVNAEHPQSIIKTDADKILEKQVSKQQENVVANEKANTISDQLKTAKTSNISANDDLYTSPKTDPSFSGLAKQSATREYVRSDMKQETEADKMYDKDKKEITNSPNDIDFKKTISGIISDATGPIPGASVSVKGTAIATQTDLDGKYTIEAKEGEELVFSFVGMEQAVAVVGNNSRIDGKLAENAQLDEVVVTADYGIKRNAKSIQKVKGSELSKTTKQDAELFTEKELEDFLNQNIERKIEVKDKVLMFYIDGEKTSIDLAKTIFYTIEYSRKNHITNLKLHLMDNDALSGNVIFQFRGVNRKQLNLAVETMKTYEAK
ncbi:MAG TPA: carboxypeptidase-like regulatory domain-containing protein [Flavobacterium sp.]|nr:carboxypeptidase-like regulatory domain-containing protein [Flavobacterium sp.]